MDALRRGRSAIGSGGSMVGMTHGGMRIHAADHGMSPLQHDDAQGHHDDPGGANQLGRELTRQSAGQKTKAHHQRQGSQPEHEQHFGPFDGVAGAGGHDVHRLEWATDDHQAIQQTDDEWIGIAAQGLSHPPHDHTGRLELKASERCEYAQGRKPEQNQKHTRRQTGNAAHEGREGHNRSRAPNNPPMTV